MTNLMNHFLSDTVSFQILTLVLLAFALHARGIVIGYSQQEPPSTFGSEGLRLAAYLFAAIGGMALYYGFGWRTLVGIACWALHVGVLWFARGMAIRGAETTRGQINRAALLNDLARLEAIAALGVLFYKR